MKELLIIVAIYLAILLFGTAVTPAQPPVPAQPEVPVEFLIWHANV